MNLNALLSSNVVDVMYDNSNSRFCRFDKLVLDDVITIR
jgi:hypothetical protein